MQTAIHTSQPVFVDAAPRNCIGRGKMLLIRIAASINALAGRLHTRQVLSNLPEATRRDIGLSRVAPRHAPTQRWLDSLR